MPAVLCDKLVVVLGQADLVHLPRFPQSLKLNLILNMKGGLPFLKRFIKGLWIKGGAVRQTEQQAVVVIFWTQKLLVGVDGLQATLYFLKQWGCEVLLAPAALSLGPF